MAAPDSASPIARCSDVAGGEGSSSIMKEANDRIPLEIRNRILLHAPEAIHCIVGETLCQVCIWSEEELERLAPAERPSPAEHVPGLGWVGAVLRRTAKKPGTA